MLSALGLLLGLGGWLAPAEAQDSTRTAGWAVRLGWREPADTARARSAPADSPLEIALTLTGADSLRGFQVELRVLPLARSTAWSFEAAGGCDAAVLEGVVEGDAVAPAPWRGKVTISDARALEDSTGRLMVACAFNPELLDPAKTYTLCRLRLRPPGPLEGGACPGWDAGARIELKRVQVLLPQFVTALVEDLGPALEVSFRNAP
jgi:hypothetical protein